jgi:putative sigma-54 modulation protein
MTTRMIARGLKLTGDVRTTMQTMLAGAFGRFADRVASVTAIVEDVNGPRGGADKRVRLEVRGHRRQFVQVEGLGTDVLPTLGKVLERADYALARLADRRKSLLTSAPPRHPAHS